jgi:hypothetical protein
LDDRRDRGKMPSLERPSAGRMAGRAAAVIVAGVLALAGVRRQQRLAEPGRQGPRGRPGEPLDEEPASSRSPDPNYDVGYDDAYYENDLLC